MPTPPDGVIQRLNYLTDFLFDPCDAPLTLYAETALPALLEAAMLWYAPVPDEIFTAWARPTKAMGRLRSGRKGTRGSKAGKKGPRSKLGRIVNFDTNEFIGKRLPGAELLGEATLNRGTFFLWRIFGFLQFLGLIWLVWEVVSGFWMRWISLLYESEYCQASAVAILDAEEFGQLIGAGLNPLLARVVNKQRGPVSYGIGTGSIGARNAKVAAGLTIEGSFPAGAYVEIVFFEGSYGTGEEVASFRTLIGGDQPRTASGSFSLKSGSTFGVGIRTNQGLMFVDHATLYVQGKPDE